ncbi:MAG: hypothetical protein P4L16_06650 [Chlamydiales bacterium]|nr:hypothetical protein [Chlamydiales bacterium]
MKVPPQNNFTISYLWPTLNGQQSSTSDDMKTWHPELHILFNTAINVLKIKQEATKASRDPMLSSLVVPSSIYSLFQMLINSRVTAQPSDLTPIVEDVFKTAFISTLQNTTEYTLQSPSSERITYRFVNESGLTRFLVDAQGRLTNLALIPYIQAINYKKVAGRFTHYKKIAEKIAAAATSKLFVTGSSSTASAASSASAKSIAISTSLNSSISLYPDSHMEELAVLMNLFKKEIEKTLEIKKRDANTTEKIKEIEAEERVLLLSLLKLYARVDRSKDQAFTVEVANNIFALMFHSLKSQFVYQYNGRLYHLMNPSDDTSRCLLDSEGTSTNPALVDHLRSTINESRKHIIALREDSAVSGLLDLSCEGEPPQKARKVADGTCASKH